MDINNELSETVDNNTLMRNAHQEQLFYLKRGKKKRHNARLKIRVKSRRKRKKIYQERERKIAILWIVAGALIPLGMALYRINKFIKNKDEIS